MFSNCKRLMGAIAVTILPGVPVLAAESSDVLLPVHSFIASMNSGAIASAIANCGADMSIIDNVAPYHWQGKDACQQWAEKVESDAVAQGLSDVNFRLEEPTHFQVTGNSAYAVLPANYTFVQEGKPGRVQGTFTVVLENAGPGWTMVSFAFSNQ